MVPDGERRRVLIAGNEEGVRLIAEALGPDFDIAIASLLAEAMRSLGAEQFDYVVCTTRFDESRMFEFLEALRRSPIQPRPRVVCVHASAPPLASRIRRIIEVSLEALEVDALFDFPAAADARGEASARRQLRRAILGTA
jgi:CheY-like chemotaxis protein